MKSELGRKILNSLSENERKWIKEYYEELYGLKQTKESGDVEDLVFKQQIDYAISDGVIYNKKEHAETLERVMKVIKEYASQQKANKVEITLEDVKSHIPFIIKNTKGGLQNPIKSEHAFNEIANHLYKWIKTELNQKEE